MATRDHSLDQPILESAKREFLSKGFERASLKEICEAVNVTTGAVYKRYRGKEELFATIVAGTVADMEEIVHQKGNLDMKSVSDEQLIEAWNMDEAYMMWWYRFLYERYDDFVLLIKYAEGTRYSNFQHDWVETMTEYTYKFYEEAYRRGLCTVYVDKGEMHILLSAFWTTIYEPFIHGYQLEQIKEHCKLVCKLFNWYQTFGFLVEGR